MILINVRYGFDSIPLLSCRSSGYQRNPERRVLSKNTFIRILLFIDPDSPVDRDKVMDQQDQVGVNKSEHLLNPNYYYYQIIIIIIIIIISLRNISINYRSISILAIHQDLTSYRPRSVLVISQDQPCQRPRSMSVIYQDSLSYKTRSI